MGTRSAGLIVLFFSVVLYWLGFSMLRPMVALFFTDAGYSTAWIGVLMALHALIPVVFAMPAGQWIDRIGARRSVLIGALIMTFSGVCYFWGGSAGVLAPMLIGQLTNGLGSLLCWGAMQASVGQIAKRGPDAARNNHLLANFAFVNALAQFGGPVLGGVMVDLNGYSLVFAAYAGLSFLCVLCSFLIPASGREAERTEGLSLNFWKSYASGVGLLKENRPFSVAMMFNGVLFVLVDMKGTFLPIYLAGMEYTNTQIGMILSFGGIASIAVRPFVGTLINRLGHRLIMFGSLWLGILCLIVLTFEPGYWSMMGIVFLWGLCAGINQPVALIMVANTVSEGRQGMGMSLRTMVNRIIQVVNPVVVGGISAVIGLTYSFGLIAALLLGFGVFMKKSLVEHESS